jgi:hypothetical protein
MKLTSCQQALKAIADRLDPILSPLGFTFSLDQAGSSSGGEFASGFYSGGDIKIGLIYRAGHGLGGVVYENSRYNVSHTHLMERLGHANDCKLAYDKEGLTSHSRGGGDAVDALIDDLQNFARNVLVGDEARFNQIVEDARAAWLGQWDIRPGSRRRQGLIDALRAWARKWGM